MLKAISKSPWTGAIVGCLSIVWEGFWLVGPPIGIGPEDKKWVLFWGAIALGVAFTQSFWALRRRIKELEDALNSAPKLIARGVSDIRTDTQADFYHLRIANDPLGAQRRETAEKVAGTVRIFDENDMLVAPIRIHRWAASPFIPGFPDKSDLQLPIDIDANGVEHGFDVAHKWENEPDFFTHNNQSVAKYGYKDPNYKFGPGTYIAVIEIKGKNTVAKFRCKIVNRGSTRKLDISII